VPDELSINLTVIGAQPAIGPAEKFATGLVSTFGWPTTILQKSKQAINIGYSFTEVIFNGGKIICYVKIYHIYSKD